MAIERSFESRPKVGLALGTGAARGLAHIGVLEVLEKEQIPIDIIAGTSVGAVVGAALASGMNASEIHAEALNLNWRKLAYLIDLSVPRAGFLSNRRFKSRLKDIIGDIEFSDLHKPFACVASDIVTGEQVVFRDGSVLDAIVASSCVPVFFRPARYQGRFLVDGLFVNPVPVQLARDMGADFVISVNVVHRANEVIPHMHPKRRIKEREPNMLDIMLQSAYLLTSRLMESFVTRGDVAIEPRMPHIGYGDFHRARECIECGRAAALQAMPEIKRQLLVLRDRGPK